MMSTSSSQSTISPTEDLMREHGVLIRILLIYQDAIKQLKGEKTWHTNLIAIIFNTTTIAQQFIENYHQQLEETYVFPKMLQEHKHAHLIQVLLEQHAIARQISNSILWLCTSHSIIHLNERFHFINLLSHYIRLYEPHSAREDTVLFPAFRELVSGEKLAELGELFEKIEEQKFGINGFQNIVNQIAKIEQSLGIYNLANFN